MKKFKILILALIMAFLVACSNNSSNDTTTSAPSESYSELATDSSSPEMEEQESIIENTSLENRKIIVSYDFYFDTSNYDNSISEINRLVELNKGYHTSINESTSGIKSSSMRISIPRENVNKFIEEITSIENLNLLNKSLYSEDITTQYTDTTLRLETLEEKLDRLNALQENQSELDQLLLLENEITETVFEIERLQGQINSLDSKVDYTEFSISVDEIGMTNTQSRTTQDFGARISRAFSDSITNFLATAGDLIIGIIYLLPLIVIVLIIAFIVRFISKKFPRKQKDIEFIKSRRRTRKKDDNENFKNLDNK